jgi:hypothetical protein
LVYYDHLTHKNAKCQGHKKPWKQRLKEMFKFISEQGTKQDYVIQK